jgi:hypothetical protein
MRRKISLIALGAIVLLSARISNTLTIPRDWNLAEKPGTPVKTAQSASHGAPIPDVPPSDVLFQNDELLSNPTSHSLTLSLLPAEQAQIYVEYGPARGFYPLSTDTQTVMPDEPAVFTLDGAPPDADVYYRVRCRKPGSTQFGARREHRGRTLRSLHPTFSFAFAADSHVFWAWVDAECRNDDTHALYFGKTMENILAADVDFLILGGDEALTHSFTLPDCPVNGESTGTYTVATQREAELRWLVTRRYYEQVGHSVPLLFVLGNHEGEAGFADGSCNYYSETMEYSANARLKYIPNPFGQYGGGPAGNYYAFRSGDALFVILDVYRYTTTVPDTPDDWSLGEEQRSWLEGILSDSTGGDARWKFVFSHHLVGGDPLIQCYQYGRGGLKATDNGEINGTFLGEQSIVHQLMKDNGGDVFFYGHDHVFSMAEKVDSLGQGEGIYYVTGGRPGGPPNFWIQEDWFKQLYDYDGDGVEDYLTDHGFLRVTVHGMSHVNVQYIKTDPFDPDENGKIIFEQDIGM